MMLSKAWAAQVVKHLTSTPERRRLTEAAVSHVRREMNMTPNLFGLTVTYAVDLLPEMRGDEPAEAEGSGDTPEDYADFLIEEWELFGPAGE